MKSIQEKVNTHMLKLFQRKVAGLPTKRVLNNLLTELSYESAADKSRYITELYYAIKDLFTVEEHGYIKVIKIDEAERSITTVSIIRLNPVGIKEGEPITKQVETNLFEAAYSGKRPDQIAPVTFTITKLDRYAKFTSLDELPTESEIDLIAAGVTGEGIEAEIDALFKDVIDVRWSKMTFEEFIEEYASLQSLGGIDRLNKREEILIHFYEGGNMVPSADKQKYKDYLPLSSPQYRLTTAGKSISTLKPFIQNIKNVIPYLTEKARQQAESELATLKSMLTVEK
jgi:hypothetical protein